MDKGGALRERGERLRDAAGAIGIMRAAKDAGVPYTTLRDYMAGGDMKLSIVAALARACGVTIDWIAHGGDRSPQGAAGYAASLPTPSAPIDLGWLSHRLGLTPVELVSFVALGDAMEPVIREGDVLVAHRLERAVLVAAVYAIDLEGSLVARRLEQLVDGTVILKADNPRYEAQVVAPGQERAFRVVGPIVWQAGPMRSGSDTAR